MRSIVTYSPFHDLHRFADMMDRMWDAEPALGGAGVPMDVWEQNNDIFIKAAVPGVDPNKIDLSLENGVLTISGEFGDEHETPTNERKMYHREMRYGRFTRSVTLPENADEDHIGAEYRHGYLTIRIPRLQRPEKTETKKLPIRNADNPKPVQSGRGEEAK